MTRTSTIACLAFLGTWTVCTPAQETALPAHHVSSYFAEHVRLIEREDGVRIAVNAPSRAAFDAKRPTQVVVYATPNGNTIEQTLGCAKGPGLDWHFGIQHIAAQIRLLREYETRQNIVLACVQADSLSWPAWRAGHKDAGDRIRGLVTELVRDTPGSSVRVTLAAHSGGGSFIWGFLEGGAAIPDLVERLVLLDANYSYDDEKKHGDRILSWLSASQRNRCVVVAYDDREIVYQGKKVVGPTGGTFRACDRMLARFGSDLKIGRSTLGPCERFQALGGRFTLLRHPNPGNEILHTRLVGDMNGLVYALALGTNFESRWGAFGDPPVYTRWVQPSPGLGIESGKPASRARPMPPRPGDAPDGTALLKRLVDLPLADREREITAEILRGNVPSFVRSTFPIRVVARCQDGRNHEITYEVCPDYLSVGSDEDFVRVPLTPMTVQRIADEFGFQLPTRKMVDQIHDAATVKLEPRPLTARRESALTFIEHNAIIQTQRTGATAPWLVSGIKKDLVVSSRLTRNTGRVVIYGWCHPSGRAIQPLYAGHAESYVDYSHGARLVRMDVMVDGEKKSLTEVLGDPVLSELVSDEGALPASARRYRY